MSNPVEQYLNESGRDILLIEKDRFLNKEDIEDLQIMCRELKQKYKYNSERCNYLIEKLEYIRGLLDKK